MLRIDPDRRGVAGLVAKTMQNVVDALWSRIDDDIDRPRRIAADGGAVADRVGELPHRPIERPIPLTSPLPDRARPEQLSASMRRPRPVPSRQCARVRATSRPCSSATRPRRSACRAYRRSARPASRRSQPGEHRDEICCEPTATFALSSKIIVRLSFSNWESRRRRANENGRIYENLRCATTLACADLVPQDP